MANTSDTNPIAKLMDAAKADPKKAGFLTILVAVLAVMVFKRLSDHAPGPSIALASTSAEATGTATDTPGHVAAKPDGAGAFAEWVRQPIGPVTRNLFAINYDV